ncbi:hypothetical protein [Paraburkholderia sp. RL18-085-BIA-A]|uniref:hypothetical protein n=1 Tax=Paraburkholderia sp. RL18-085-BIA-A TaxID=3031633 RepID=UPI0038B6D056
MTEDQLSILKRLADVLEAGRAENGIAADNASIYASAIRAALASSDAQADGGKSEAVAWQDAFNERHEFDVYPDHFMTGLRNEFAAGWYAALKSTAPQAECAPRKPLKALYEVLMRRNIECGSEAYLTLRCVGVPPSKKEFVRAIEQAAKERV